MSKFRKVFTSGLMFVTVLAMSVVVAPQVDAAASAGDLIKMEGLSSVYYLGSDGKRYVFPNATTYFSWYEDFSMVKTIPQSELESYPLGKNITIRPGTYLVKIQTDPKVYAVEPNGDLVHVPDEATAEALYGENWADRVVDVPDAFFTNYNRTGDEVSSDAFPAGSLVNYGEGNIYYVDADGEARWIEDEAAFEANRFDWDDVLTAPEGMTMPAEGDSITGFETALFDPSAGAGGQAGAGTGLTVALASDTPTSQNVPAGSPVEFLKFNMTASNDGPVIVNSVAVSALGLTDEDRVDDVTIYVDGMKETTSKSMTERDVVLNFSGGYEIAAGETASMAVRATYQDGQEGNVTLGVNEASDIDTNGAVVSGSFPIEGNTMGVTDINIGTVTLDSYDDNAGTYELGEDDVLLASLQLSASNEDVIWESARFENKGDEGVVDNVRIEVEGDEIAEAEVNGDYYSFDLGNYLIEEDESVDVEVRGDIAVTDTSDDFQLIIDELNDFSFVGQDYGFGIEMDDSTGDDYNDTTADRNMIKLEAGQVTIDMDKSSDTGTPARDVRADQDNVTLATITITSNGEDATLEEIVGTSGNFYISTSSQSAAGTDLTNIELRDVDGGLYDLETNFTGDVWELSTDEEITLPFGVTKRFRVEADLGNGLTNGTGLSVTLKSGALSITGDVSDDSISNITPSAVTSATLTIEEASLEWTTESLTNKTVVEGADDLLVYAGQVEAGDASDIELQSVKLSEYTGAGNALDNDNITALTLMIDGEEVQTISNDIEDEGAADAYVEFGDLDDYTVPAGEAQEVLVYASFSSSFTSTGSFALEVDADADIDAKDEDNDDVTNKDINTNIPSRVVTLAESGSLKVELKTDDTEANDDTYLLAGSETQSGRYLGELVFTTDNEPVELETLTLNLDANSNAADGSDIKYIRLYDEDGEVVAEVLPESDGDAEFEWGSDEMVLEQSNATSLFLGVVAKSINAEGDPQGTAEDGKNIRYQITDVEAKGDASGDTIDMTGAATPGMGNWDNDAYSNTTTIAGSVLTAITSVDLDDDYLSGGITEVAKYKFVFDNGDNRATTTDEAMKAQMQEIVLTVSKTAGITADDWRAYFEGDSGNTSATSSDGTIDLATIPGDLEYVDGEVVLVIEANLSDVTENDYFQTEINDLASGDFTYDSNGVDAGGTVTNPRLDITRVTGDKLTN